MGSAMGSGARYNYTGMLDGLSQVVAAEGVKGLFRGFEAAVGACKGLFYFLALAAATMCS
jgi:hypothetical protein